MGNILQWLLSVSFLLIALGRFGGAPESGFLLIIGAVILIPPVWKIISKKTNLNTSRWTQAVIVSLIFIIAIAITPESSESKIAKTKTAKAEPAVYNQGNDPNREVTKLNWTYSETEDAMTSKKVYTARATAVNTLDFDFPYQGGSVATLTIRKKGSTDIMLQISKGQFMSNYSGGKIRVRFDTNPAKTYNVSSASDGSSDVLFIRNEANFVANLKKSKTVLIEAEFYQEGNRQMTFNISDLKWEH